MIKETAKKAAQFVLFVVVGVPFAFTLAYMSSGAFL